MQRTESYGYDQDLDYLTSVNYGDGSTVQTWEYDAAGNRSSASANPGSWSYDNLNRMTASPGVTYDHDSLGNRMLKTAGGNSTAYGWDAVNRMTSIGPSSSAKTQYSYRADGMRVKKVLPGGDVTRSYYDGQKLVEEDSVVSGTSSVTRNFVGARGIESIFTTTTSGTTTAFPLYDCHGNMVATVSRSGAGFVTSNIRTYDVWGGVRTGATTGGPKGRYVANLGHVQDDESGLIYMRARYYEPESGRFISEDSERDGVNWFIYCGNEPINRVDANGNFWWFIAALAIIGAIGGMICYNVYQKQSGGEITPGGYIGSAIMGAFAGIMAALIAVTAASGAGITAAAAGAIILEAIAIGIVSVIVSALAGEAQKRIDQNLKPGTTMIERTVGTFYGYQILLALEMCSD